MHIVTLASPIKNELGLSKWEVQILKCIKRKAITEKRIAKELSLDINIVSSVITDLMLRGYVERVRKRRMYFSSREYFSATMDGIMALETSLNNAFWNQLMSLLKDQTDKLILELSTKSPIFGITFKALRVTHAITRFVMK